MAIGDAAAAAALQVWATGTAAQVTYEALNMRGDELAAHITGGGHPFTKISGQIAAGQIPTAGIPTAKLAADAGINAAMLASSAVTNAKLANGAVDGGKMAATVSKSSSFTFEGAPLRLKNPSGMTVVDIDSTGFDATAPAFDVESAAIELQTPNGVAGLVIGSNEATARGQVVALDASGTVELEGSSATVVVGNSVTATGATVALNGGTASFAVGNVGGADRVFSDTIRTLTTSSAANVWIDDTTGVLRRSTSSRRYKDDIEDAEDMPAILDVQPRTWVDKNDPDGARHFGAIAEELDDLGLHELVVYVDDEPEAIAYDRIAVALIPVVRAQRDLIADLAARVAALEAKGA